MSTNAPRTPMNDDITDWGKRQTPPENDTRRLAADIVARLPEQPQPDQRPRPLAVPWPARIAAAAALVLAGVLLGNWLQQTHTRTDTGPSTQRPTPGALSDADVDEIRQVANEIDRLFPRGVRWVAKINGHVSFQPERKQRITPDERDDQRILISYAVTRRNGQTWQVVTRHDIVTYADEPVEINNGSTVSVWCHLTDDHNAVVAAELNLDASDNSLQVREEALQPLDRPRIVLATSAGKTDYRVIQTIRAL